MTPATILLRQSHPNFIPDGVLTSQVFMPNSEDEGRMSVYDGDQITPVESYRHYTEVLGKQSHSVWGLTKAEVDDAGVPAEPNALLGFPSHSIIDFGNRGEKECRRIAKRLKALALSRGCLYLPVQGAAAA